MTNHAHYRVDDFAGPNCIGYLISQAHANLRPQVEALFEREDIGFSQWRVLMCLRDKLANTCVDISRELSHDKGSVTRLIDQLEERGLLKRQRDPGDRRVVFLALTPAGRAAVNRLVPKIVAYFNTLLSTFSPQEAKLLVQLLTKLKTALQPWEEATGPGLREGARPS
jgi:DNA-binding MarR family transcriptional regulator